ncbi:MAG: VOC family protein [Flavobacterium sp.]|jgi:hypothetical protein|nr:VOC family protein [Flavobacterium sp.]
MKIVILFFVLCIGCNNINSKKTNPVVYFEIPVKSMERAVKFYRTVFDFEFQNTKIDNYDMSLFPFEKEALGISGSLAKGDVYVPTKNGVILYFKTESIDETLRKAISLNSKILYPKTDNGHGYVAEIEDSEGNRIALLEYYK